MGEQPVSEEVNGPMQEPPLDEIVPWLADKLQILADSTRLAILFTLLRSGELNAGTLGRATGRTAPNVSKHLRLLTNAGMVTRRKEGLQVYYRLHDPLVEKIYHLGCEVIPKGGHRPGHQGGEGSSESDG